MSEIRTRDPQVTDDELELPQHAPQANVLLVDDQPARLLSYEAILSGMGVNCVRALSGAAALAALLEQQFAVILLDVHMPEMDGFEVAGSSTGCSREQMLTHSASWGRPEKVS